MLELQTHGTATKMVQTKSFTIYIVQELRFGVEMGEGEQRVVEKITWDDNYPRFTQRRRSFGTIFILLTETFNDTTAAIKNTGYATAGQVVYFIGVTKLSCKNLVIDQFQTNLFVNSELTIFGAPVVFLEFGRNGGLSIFCNFCPNGTDKFILNNRLFGKVAYSLILTRAQFRHGHAGPSKFLYGGQDVVNEWRALNP